MSQTTYISPVDHLSGRIVKKSKTGTVQRTKIYRDEKGRVIGQGANESYIIENPRNYIKQPLSAQEQLTVNSFRDAAAQYQLEKNDPERMAYWRQRFNDQLHRPDPEASIDQKTGRRRTYKRLDIFMRTIIQLQLRREQSPA